MLVRVMVFRRVLLVFQFFHGTLVSNIVAAFIIGLTIGAGRQSVVLPERVKLFLSAGLSGGLSTFSTFSLETVTMMEQWNYTCRGNIVLNVFLVFSLF